MRHAEYAELCWSNARLSTQKLHARARGASAWRVIPAALVPGHTRDSWSSRTTVLVPPFIMAEATLSFVWAWFSDAYSSWGAMLGDVAAVQVPPESPGWLLAPAAAIVIAVFVVHSRRNVTRSAPVGSD
jgi:ABC-type dipeptide/oligopeptide/nickel transport system permease subunit